MNCNNQKKIITMKKMTLCLMVFLTLEADAQETENDPKKPTVTISGYLETYYQYSFNKPGDQGRPAFVYSHNRHNEFNLNLGFLKASYTAERVRANLALASGTYVNANYAAEPGVLKNIYEANAGIKLSKNANLWLDAGIFSSHIGFESAVSKDCWTLTRSILADNSPYYEAGAKLSYTSPNEQWTLMALALNGWQRIQRVNGNSLMSTGTQVQFRPTGRTTLNYSTFFGTDKPDSARLFRTYHNFYGQMQLSDHWGLILGFDLGTEEKAGPAKGTNTWISPVGILKYAWHDQWALAGRVEYFGDESGVIISSTQPSGFKATGLSINLDHKPTDNTLVRLELRHFTGKQPQFTRDNAAVNSETFITGSIALSF